MPARDHRLPGAGIDEREAPLPLGPAVEAAPHIERICVEPVQAEVASAPPGAIYLMLTHSHDLELAITHAIPQRGDFGFLGLIGSKTKRGHFERRLQERGFSPERLARPTAPDLPDRHRRHPRHQARGDRRVSPT